MSTYKIIYTIRVEAGWHEVDSGVSTEDGKYFEELARVADEGKSVMRTMLREAGLSNADVSWEYYIPTE